MRRDKREPEALTGHLQSRVPPCSEQIRIEMRRLEEDVTGGEREGKQKLKKRVSTGIYDYHAEVWIHGVELVLPR